MTPLSPPEITAALEDLPHWTHREGALQRELRFQSFREAMSFLLRAAFVAEAHQHHPEWSIVHDRVSIRLTTHDAGDRVTARDVKLARAFGNLARPAPSHLAAAVD